MKQTEKTNFKEANLKNKNAITLIALVVTIVVLLILAGVTISLLLDENGIIAKSKYARLKNRASQVEDEIGMWKQNNFINKESGQTQEEADILLTSLISRNLLKEDEIDREQEIITIKKNDGSILKQISYSKVTINISKQPETEKSGAVLLTVDSVEGITMPIITSEDELNEYVASLSETQKKEIIKNSFIKLVNMQDSTVNCKTFEELLVVLKNSGEIEEATEEAFWQFIESNGGVDEVIMDETVGLGAFYNKKTGRIECYTITNLDGETSNTYIATENGTYTFKVKDIITGKTYTKKIDVTNVDESVKYYVANERSSNLPQTESKITTKLATTKPIKLAYEVVRPHWCICLKDTQTKSLQTFTTAYIIYNNQKIDISSKIQDYNGYSYLFGWDIGNFLEDQTENFNRDEFEKEIYQFIIEKDGIEYKGFGKVCEE